MPRPPIPPLTWGKITVKRVGTGDKAWHARGAFYDWKGDPHRLNGFGPSKSAAEARLRRKDQNPAYRGGTSGALTPRSTLNDAHAVWWNQLLGEQHSDALYRSYEGVWRRRIQPVLGKTRIDRITVATIDNLLDNLRAGYHASDHRQARNVLTQIFDTLERLNVVTSNPVRRVSKANKRRWTVAELQTGKKKPPRALTDDEVKKVLRYLWELEQKPTRAGQRRIPLLDIFMIGLCGLRIGEVCALRRMDVDLEGSPGLLLVRHTLVRVQERDWATGKKLDLDPNTSRWELVEGGKGGYSARAVAMPPSVEARVRAILATRGRKTDPLIPNARGTFFDQNNIRRRWREIRDELGLGDVTPHSLRKTAATTVADTSGADKAALLLGHSSPDMTREAYINRDQLKADAATDLETLFTPLRDVSAE